MKINCKKNILLKVLQNVHQMENCKLSASEKGLQLKATDMKVALSYTFPSTDVQIIESGELFLSVERLFGFLKETPDTEITLESSDLNLILKSCKAQASFCGQEPGKYPEISEQPGSNTLELASEDFAKLIRKTQFATTQEKTRYDLENVLITNMGDKLRFVATDGKRLSLCEKKYKTNGDVKPFSFTVPVGALRQIEKALSSFPTTTLLFGVGEYYFFVQCSNFVMSARLANAKFPDYEKVIPQNLSNTAQINTKELISALRRIAILSNDKIKTSDMSFSPTMLKVYSMGEGTGEATVEIPIVFEGKPFETRFNITFLLEALKYMEDEINFHGESTQSPSLIKDGEDFLYVVLPIKI